MTYNYTTYNKGQPYTASMWRAIQREVGAYPDGVPGVKTGAAIAKWQEAHGLVADRKCGPETMLAMGLSPFTEYPDGFWWSGKMAICADGSPMAYHPDDIGYDYLGNAGRPGKWWGIITDNSGKPVIQGPDDPAPGYYVSTTAMVNRDSAKHSPARYVDAANVPYIVLPRNLVSLLPGRLRPTLGHRHVLVWRHGSQIARAIYADVGPGWQLEHPSKVRGEGSIKLAEDLGHHPWRTSRGIRRAAIGITSGVIYMVGTERPTQDQISEVAGLTGITPLVLQ